MVHKEVAWQTSRKLVNCLPDTSCYTINETNKVKDDMKTNDWNNAFQPVLNLGREIRVGQAQLGQAIFDTIKNKGSLVGEAPVGSGKSFGAAIPLITSVIEAKKLGKTFRGVISTGTITLQRQIADKDLPFLLSVYPGFTYKLLMGRGNYVCLNQAKLAAYGNKDLEDLYQLLEKRKSALGTGDKIDIEKAVGFPISLEIWSQICGTSKFCSDNACSEDKSRCLAGRAREIALNSDIVVINHALLGVDTEMKNSGSDALSDGILGTIDCLIVDEAHELEPILVDQWSEELTQWQIGDMTGSVSTAMEFSKIYANPGNQAMKTNMALEDILNSFANIQVFFEQYAKYTGEVWEKFETPVSLKTIKNSKNISSLLLNAMQEYEVQTPAMIDRAIDGLESTLVYFDKVSNILMDDYDSLGVKVKNRRKFSKGRRVAKELIKTLEMLKNAITSNDGIVNNYGKTGVILRGWLRKKDNSKGVTISIKPLDVSKEAATIWNSAGSSVLMSATLMDLTEKTFRYARECVGFPDGPEIKVASPFDYKKNQMVYVSPAQGNTVEAGQYSLNELMALVEASKGRALILFTAKKELEYAADMLRQFKAKGMFNYTIYAQEDGEDKQKLLHAFTHDTDSILLGLRSFFVGVDVSGESLSHLIMAKFPLSRYSVECKMRIQVWRMKGFPNWYARESLEALAQGAGRLIRSSTDFGVVSLLDFRLMDVNSNVYKIAKTGIAALGSPVTQSVSEVEKFLQPRVLVS